MPTEAVAHAISGAAGGVIAMAVLYPLENIRTRLQVQVNKIKYQNSDAVNNKNSPISTSSNDTAPSITDKKNDDNPPSPQPYKYKGSIDCFVKVCKQEGWIKLYDGLSSALLGVGVSSAIYFFWYSNFKSVVLKVMSESSTKNKPFTNLTPLQNIIVASAAGVVNVFMTLPIWVVNTRMTVNAAKYTSIIGSIRTILGEEGLEALYKGLIPSLILVSNPAIQFVVYEQLIRLISRGLASGQTLSSFEYFLVGAFAKAVATVLTYPYQVIKSRQQAVAHTKLTTIQIIQNMIKEEGPLSLFNGMNAKLGQTVTNSGFMFLVYERILKMILYLFGITPPSRIHSHPPTSAHTPVSIEDQENQ